MLVVVGANGRTGLEIVRQAIDRGIDVRPVVRDDRDADKLDRVVDVHQISYADPDHYDSLPPALQGASRIICCVDPRTGGPGTPIYTEASSGNVVRAAREVGAELVIYLSVMGAYRWSPNSLNRKAFHLDRGVRSEDAPWCVFRVSSYIDEIIEGHVRPPDGGRPHRVSPSSRYSPLSRRDAAKLILDYLEHAVPGRQVSVGGPEIITGDALAELIAPWRQPGRGRTIYRPLPPGDVSVMPHSTRVTIGAMPTDRIEDYLDPAGEPPQRTEPAPVYARAAPGPHPTDAGKNYKVLSGLDMDLRYVVHDQLAQDLGRLGLAGDGISFDFSRARTRKTGRSADVHGGTMTQIFGVRVVDDTGIVVHKGPIDFIYDKLADEFRCWWTDGSIPEPIWLSLDLGVQRRLADKGPFAEDPLSVAFRNRAAE
jgi:uncharacterized protein YbjT (DUF2867 family)